MVSALDVDPGKLIRKTAEHLKGKVPKPEFVGLVKTGCHCTRPPSDSDFWFIRCASILRQAYLVGTIGTNQLRRKYGGRKRRGVRPERHSPTGGSTIRKAIQGLEKAGFLVKEKAGRTLSAKGRSLLDQSAKECK